MRIDRNRKSLVESIREAISHPDGKILKELYEILNVIDSKTASLLQFNALVVAILALVLSFISTGWPIWICVAGGILVMASTLLCLRIVQIEWPFIHPDRPLDAECDALSAVVDSRTCRYEMARQLSLWGIIVLVIGVVLGYALK